MTRVWIVVHEWTDYEYHEDVLAICSSSTMAKQILAKYEKPEMKSCMSWLADPGEILIKEVRLNEIREDV